MAHHIRFLWVGRIKERFWQEAAGHYWKRLSRYCKLKEVTLKDGPASSSPQDRIRIESQAIQSKLEKSDGCICLDQSGTSLTSPQLAEHLTSWLEAPGQNPCFVLGGAFGLSSDLLKQSRFVLSLGPLTLPHELARILLLEQLYRAATIMHGHPYHH
jgi:23S rRNA (pseudouridine1915-N3)-methyltransferase